MSVAPVPPAPKWTKGADLHAVDWVGEMDGFDLRVHYRNDRGIISCRFSVFTQNPVGGASIQGPADHIPDGKRKCVEAVALLKLLSK